MSVFVSGSISIKKLPNIVNESFDKIIAQNIYQLQPYGKKVSKRVNVLDIYAEKRPKNLSVGYTAIMLPSKQLVRLWRKNPPCLRGGVS